MIDEDQSLYYIAYFLLCVVIGLCYIKIKSTEGIIITTKEFKLFQSGYVNAYSLLILCELLTAASFYHVFINYEIPLEKVTKLYVVTIVSMTGFSIISEIVDIGSKKDKCALSALLYGVSMLTILSGGHYEMLLIGRLFHGAASALQQSSFESYALSEHTNRGFPDDWLTQTFVQVSHAMSLVAIVSGLIGQSSTSTAGPLGVVGLTLFLVSITAVYIIFTWSKDTSFPKFNLSGFLFNINQTLQTVKSNKQILLLFAISSLCEASVTIFTFYWAPWITSLVIEEDRIIPYEIIYSSYVIALMVGNYLYQLYGAKLGFDSIFQGVLIGSSVSYFLGAIFQTPSIAFCISIVVQFCVGGYWPCIGQLRGRLILPELRSSSLAITRVMTALLSVSVLTLVHHSPLLMLSSCAVFNGLAAYLHNVFSQIEGSKAIGMSEDNDSDEELSIDDDDA